MVSKEKRIVVKIILKESKKFFFAQTYDIEVYKKFLFKDLSKRKIKNENSVIFIIKQLLNKTTPFEQQINFEEFVLDNYLKAKEFLINVKNNNKNNMFFITPTLNKSIKKSTNNKNTRKIIIDEVQYESIVQASKSLDMPEARIKKRLKSNNWTNYCYLESSNKKSKNPKNLVKTFTVLTHNETKKFYVSIMSFPTDTLSNNGRITKGVGNIFNSSRLNKQLKILEKEINDKKKWTVEIILIDPSKSIEEEKNKLIEKRGFSNCFNRLNRSFFNYQENRI